MQAVVMMLLVLLLKHLLTLEECMEYIQQDECIEVTPKHIRMRKVQLNEEDRKRGSKSMSAESVA